MQYEIVDKPEGIARPSWKRILSLLPDNKAVKFAFKTKEEALNQGNSIQGSLRFARSPFSISRRIIQDGNIFVLYVWKRTDNAEGQ